MRTRTDKIEVESNGETFYIMYNGILKASFDKENFLDLLNAMNRMVKKYNIKN